MKFRETLRPEWDELFASTPVEAVRIQALFNKLAGAYEAPGRHYHNLEHISEMLATLRRLLPNGEKAEALRFAVWFHDAVYDPKVHDNEARSAALLRESLVPLGLPNDLIDEAAKLVMATAHFEPIEALTENAALLIDADLLNLAADDQRFRRSSEDIRREYEFVPEPEYRAGRAKILEHFLARPRIYHHPVLFAESEEKARHNLLREIERLRS